MQRCRPCGSRRREHELDPGVLPCPHHRRYRRGSERWSSGRKAGSGRIIACYARLGRLSRDLICGSRLRGRRSCGRPSGRRRAAYGHVTAGTSRSSRRRMDAAMDIRAAAPTTVSALWERLLAFGGDCHRLGHLERAEHLTAMATVSSEHAVDVRMPAQDLAHRHGDPISRPEPNTRHKSGGFRPRRPGARPMRMMPGGSAAGAGSGSRQESSHAGGHALADHGLIGICDVAPGLDDRYAWPRSTSTVGGPRVVRPRRRPTPRATRGDQVGEPERAPARNIRRYRRRGSRGSRRPAPG
jgi:hypothetical protein